MGGCAFVCNDGLGFGAGLTLGIGESGAWNGLTDRIIDNSFF